MPKVNQQQHKERIYTVYSMLLDGHDRPTIIQFGTKTWGVIERAVDSYIHRANELIDKHYEEKRYQKLRRSLMRRSKLMTRAVKKGDFNLAHEIVKDIDRLEGMYPAEKHRIDGTMTLSDFLRNERIIKSEDQ